MCCKPHLSGLVGEVDFEIIPLKRPESFLVHSRDVKKGETFTFLPGAVLENRQET